MARSIKEIKYGASLAARFSRGIRQLTGCACHVVEATSRNFSRIEETPDLRKYHYAIAGQTAPVEISMAEENFHWGSLRPAPKR